MRQIKRDGKYLFWEKDIVPPKESLSVKPPSQFYKHLAIIVFLLSASGLFLVLFNQHVQAVFRNTHKRTLTIVDNKTRKDSIYIVVTAGESNQKEEGYYRFYPCDTVIYFRKQNSQDLSKWDLDSLYPRYIKLDVEHHVFEVLSDDWHVQSYQSLDESEKKLLAWDFYFNQKLREFGGEWYYTNYTMPKFFDVGDCAVGRANKDTTIYFHSIRRDLIPWVK